MLRRQLKTRRVGHSGTLDPQATGVLVIAVGPATRFLQYLPLEPKEYLGEVTFGVVTSTYDREGEILSQVDPGPDLKNRVEVALEGFRGMISQIPPMHSAVKVDGKPLYSYARQGIELERKSRSVHIDLFEVLEWKEPHVARVRVVCSGGTYLRSLAHDLGAAVGCGAHLSGLIRSGVGKFSLDEALPPAEITTDALLPLRAALAPLPMVPLNPLQVGHIREGRTIRVKSEVHAPVVALLDQDGQVFAIARSNANLLKPECVIPANAAPDL